MGRRGGYKLEWMGQEVEKLDEEHNRINFLHKQNGSPWAKCFFAQKSSSFYKLLSAVSLQKVLPTKRSFFLKS